MACSGSLYQFFGWEWMLTSYAGICGSYAILTLAVKIIEIHAYLAKRRGDNNLEELPLLKQEVK